MSTVVDANTFKCVIELAEEDTEYEIMVVPETSARSRIILFWVYAPFVISDFYVFTYTGLKDQFNDTAMNTESLTAISSRVLLGQRFFQM